MIPADVASRLRLVTQEQPAPPQAVSPTSAKATAWMVREGANAPAKAIKVISIRQ